MPQHIGRKRQGIIFKALSTLQNRERMVKSLCIKHTDKNLWCLKPPFEHVKWGSFSAPMHRISGRENANDSVAAAFIINTKR